ncbi:MAG: hypothetical protein AAFQ98_07260 [Bacteroidota bacterium]
MRRLHPLLVLFAFVASTTTSQAQWFRYPKPEGVPYLFWKTISWEWAYSSRSVEVTTINGTQYQGLLLGAFDEGIALMDGAFQPFVAVEGTQVRLVEPDSIFRIKLKTLNYQWHPPALVIAATTALLYVPFRFVFGPLEAMYAAAFSAGIPLGGIVAGAQVLVPYVRWIPIQAPFGQSYETVQRKLSRFEQVENWETAQSLSDLAPSDPLDPNTYSSLFPAMPKVARSFRHRPWSIHTTLPYAFLSAMRLRVSNRYGYVSSHVTSQPQVSLRYQQTPQIQLSVDYQPLYIYHRARNAPLPDELGFTDERLALDLNEVRVGMDYALITDEPFLMQRHKLTAGVAAGIQWGTNEQDRTVELTGSDEEIVVLETTKNILRPTIQSRLTYTFSLTQSIGLQLDLATQTSGFISEPEHHVVSQEQGTEILIPTQNHPLVFTSVGCGFVVKL